MADVAGWRVVRFGGRSLGSVFCHQDVGNGLGEPYWVKVGIDRGLWRSGGQQVVSDCEEPRKAQQYTWWLF